MIRKRYLAFPNPYPVIIMERKHFVLSFPCVFKEEEYSTEHFPHKISPTDSLLNSRSLYKHYSSWGSQRSQKGFSTYISTRPVHVSILVFLKSSDLKPQNGRSDLQ